MTDALKVASVIAAKRLASVAKLRAKSGGKKMTFKRDKLREAKADAWDEGFEIGRCTGQPQLNPYRSKNDE